MGACWGLWRQSGQARCRCYFPYDGHEFRRESARKREVIEVYESHDWVGAEFSCAHWAVGKRERSGLERRTIEREGWKRCTWDSGIDNKRVNCRTQAGPIKKGMPMICQTSFNVHNQTDS